MSLIMSIRLSPSSFQKLRPCLVLLALAVAAGLYAPASQAQQPVLVAPDDSPSDPNGLLSNPEPLVEPAAASDVVNYSDQAMSISFPKDWSVDEIENGILISNVTTVPADLIATQIVSIDAPPGAVVDANINSFLEEGSVVGRYRTVTIDGQTALVMWISERPDDLSRAIATFIGYGNQTVLLFSRYSPENAAFESTATQDTTVQTTASQTTANQTTEAQQPSVEERILQIHTSFANLAIQTASADEPASNAAE